MLPVGFEPTISAGERPQTYALDHAATGTGIQNNYISLYQRRDSKMQIKQNTKTGAMYWYGKM